VGGGKGRGSNKGVNLVKVKYIHGWNSVTKPFWTNEYTLKKWRLGMWKEPVRGWVPVGGGRVNGEGEGGWIGLIYFIYLYGKRTMKSVEIVLSVCVGKGVGRIRKNNGRS
jgi:hypothetical protein